MTSQKENIDIEKGIEMPEGVRKAVEKQKLPGNLHQQMSAMNTQRTLFAVRASVRRFYEKNGHEFRFVANEESDDIGSGVRIYKFHNDQSEVVSLEAD